MADACNIADLVVEQAAQRPWQRAVVFPETRDRNGNVAWTHLSFDGLNRLSDAYARGLAERGVSRGDRVSLLVRPSLEFVPLVFALFKLGALPVLIDPGMGRKQFLACIERIRPRVLVALPLVHALRTLFPGAFRSVVLSVTAGGSALWWGGITLEECRVEGEEPFEVARTAAGDEAAILFTSGSTGPAKGVTYTHGIFSAQTRHIQEMYGIEPGEVDLACFPLFGLFSVGMGMTMVIPDMDPTKVAQVDPSKLVEAIQTHGCTSAFGSPTIWKRVAPYCLQQGVRLPTLRRILMAGAPVPVDLHEAFQSILPAGAQIHTPYGATESLPVATIGSHEVLDETRFRTAEGWGTCVGHPAPGIDIRIVAISDDPIEAWSDDLVVPDGEVGEICVCGAVVTREYKDEPEHTRSAKIFQGETVWHRIGDLGWFDARGRLWFCGRKAHRVQTADGRTLFTVPCEAIFNGHPDVARTALVGVHGQPVLIVEPVAGSSRPHDELSAELLTLGKENERTESIGRVLFHPSFPVDVRHNAKIDRPALARWAAGQGSRP